MAGQARAGRMLALAGVVLYAGLALGSGADRIAAQRPALDRWVPEPFAAAAPEARAREAIAAGQPKRAAGPALVALARSPSDPGPLALLGLSRLSTGELETARRAFELSARLGWREPLTQVYWFQAAMAAGDLPRAIQRFDAMARQYPSAPAVSLAAGQLEASPAGKAALARAIAGGANWAKAYAAPDATAPQSQLVARSAVLLAAARLGYRLGCDDAQKLTGALAAFDPGAAASLWHAECEHAPGPGALADPNFARLTAVTPRVPFEWELVGHGELESVLRPNGSGQQLELRSTAAVALPVLAQRVALSPGRYTLSWQGEGTGRVRPSLSCQRGALPAAAPAARSAEFAVKADCPAPWVELWLVPGSAPVLIDGVALRRY